MPSKPPDESRQPDELSELLSLLGAAAQLAGCWLYVEDRFDDGTVRSAYDAPGFGALFGDPDLEEITWRDHVLAEDEEILNSLAVVAPGDSFDVRYRLRGVDGVVRVMRDRGRVHLTAAGAVRVWGTVRNITDKHEIRETVARIGETIDEYYFTDELRPDGTYETIFATSAIDRLLGGIPAGMTYGQAWHAAVHPDDRALAGSLVDQLRAGESVDVEYRMLGFDGVTRWIWVRCAVRETQPDGTRILDGVAQDVTIRHDAQARLTEIAEAIDEVLYVEEHRPDGSIVETYSTSGIHRLYGLDRDAPVPAWRPYIHPEDRSISDELDAKLRQLGTGDVEYRLVGADGRVRWIRDRVRSRLRSDGVVIAEGILADVTAEKEALLALEAARQEADRLARVDPLTGAFNRRHFSEAAGVGAGARRRQGTGTRRCCRRHRPLQVLNDLHGHAVGDEVLVRRRRARRRRAARLRHAGPLGRRGVRRAAAGPRPATTLLRRWPSACARAVEDRPVRRPRLAVCAHRLGRRGLAPTRAASTRRGLVERADRALYAAKDAAATASCCTATWRGDGVPRSPRPCASPQALALARRARGHAADAPRGRRRAVVARGARSCGSSIDAVLRCRLGGWLHDVGKVAVPDHILSKPGPLDRGRVGDHARARRDRRASWCARARLADAAPPCGIITSDGTAAAIRTGSRGEDIPLEARIVAVVDAYSAMTSPRVYSKARSSFAAIAELERCAGTHFDPAVVSAFHRVLELAGITADSA